MMNTIIVTEKSPDWWGERGGDPFHDVQLWGKISATHKHEEAILVPNQIFRQFFSTSQILEGQNTGKEGRNERRLTTLSSSVHRLPVTHASDPCTFVE